MKTIDTRSDQSEKIKYSSIDYPVYIQEGRLSEWKDYTVSGHWHEDIELIAVKSGKLDYYVNDKKITVHEGDGIFINGRQFHGHDAKTKEECIYICVLLHPLLMCAFQKIEKKYVLPILNDRSLSYFYLERSTGWQKKILDDIYKMNRLSGKEYSELEIQALIYHLWNEVYRNVVTEKKKSLVQGQYVTQLQKMLFCIHDHYREKLTLQDICEAGNVGKTTAISVFKKYMKQTPVEYLIEYRIQKSMELLQSTDMTITEICYEVGFGGTSYFSETFQKKVGCSPKEYRKKQPEPA